MKNGGKINFVITLIIIFFINIASILALSPERKLANEEQENRAMNLFLTIRCLVCNGQVIENSDTKFAYDMRELVRSQITEGKSDDEIKKYLIDNFGTDILNEPSKISLILLLAIPFILSLIIFAVIFRKNLINLKR